MYKKILFATDNKEHSNRALPHLEDIAGNKNAEVIVFNSYYIPEYFKQDDFNSHYMDQEKMEKNLVEHGNKILDEVKNKLEAKNIKTKTILENGPAGPAIVKTAVSEGCDLIIIGTRGLGNIHNNLISSVSNYVIHNSKCSVLMVQ
jgi:nucleotide-binding universal stress UspA family protein